MVLAKRNSSLRYILTLAVVTGIHAEGFKISIKPFAAITLNKKSTQAIISVEKNLSKTNFQWKIDKANDVGNRESESRFFVSGVDPYQGKWIWSFEDYVRRYTAEDAEPFLNKGFLETPRSYGPFGPNVWVTNETFRQGLSGNGNVYIDRNWQKLQVQNDKPSEASNLFTNTNIRYLPARSEKFFSIYRSDLVTTNADKDIDVSNAQGETFLPVTDLAEDKMKIFVIFDDSLTDDKSKFKGGPKNLTDKHILTEDQNQRRKYNIPSEGTSYSHEFSTFTRVALASSRVLRDRDEAKQANRLCYDGSVLSSNDPTEKCPHKNDLTINGIAHKSDNQFLPMFISGIPTDGVEADLGTLPMSLYQPGPASATGTPESGTALKYDPAAYNTAENNGYLQAIKEGAKTNVPMAMTNISEIPVLAVDGITEGTKMPTFTTNETYLSSSTQTIEYQENFDIGYANHIDIYGNQALKNGVNLSTEYTSTTAFDQRYADNTVFASGEGLSTMTLSLNPVPFADSDEVYTSHINFFGGSITSLSSHPTIRTTYIRGTFDESKFSNVYAGPADTGLSILGFSVMIPPRNNPGVAGQILRFDDYDNLFNDDFRRFRPSGVKRPGQVRGPFNKSQLTTQRYLTPEAGNYYIVIPHMHDTFNKDMYRMGGQHALENCQDMVWGCANSNYLEDLFVIKPVNATSINKSATDEYELKEIGRGQGYNCKAPNSLRNNNKQGGEIDPISGEVISASVGKENTDYSNVEQKQFVSIYDDQSEKEATYWGGVCHPLVTEQRGDGETDQVYKQRDYDQLEYYDTTIGLEASIGITDNINGILRTSLSAPIEYVEHTSKFIKIRPFTNIGLHAGIAFGSDNGKLSITYGMNSERVTAELTQIGLSERTGTMEPSDLIKGRTDFLPNSPTPRFLDLINSKEQVSTFYSSVSINASIQLTSALGVYVNSEISDSEYDIDLINIADKSKILNQRLSFGVILDYQE